MENQNDKTVTSTEVVEQMKQVYDAAGAVKVKALEWERENADGTVHYADSVLGEYSVWEIDGFGYWSHGGLAGRVTDGGLTGGKAAAQADYEQLILSALEATPEGRQPTCIACDDKPISSNDPCAVCGTSSRPAEQAVIDKVLDAAGDYMSMQYGNTALHHPTDRARIKAAMEAGR